MSDDQTGMPRIAYNPITPSIVDELRGIVGAKNVLYGDPLGMIDYAHDEVSGAEHAHMPDVVVKPRTAKRNTRICLTLWSSRARRTRSRR